MENKVYFRNYNWTFFKFYYFWKIYLKNDKNIEVKINIRTNIYDENDLNKIRLIFINYKLIIKYNEDFFHNKFYSKKRF